MNHPLEPTQARFKRRPLLALFLNGLTMGLGHLYLGRPRRALLFYLSVASLQLALFLMVFLVPPSAKLAVFIPGFALWVAAHILGMLDAFRLARQLGRGVFEKRWFQCVPAYVAYCVLGTTLFLSLARMERRHLVNIYHVSSKSMSPTLMGGDYILTNRQYDCVECRHALARGDIVVFETDGKIWVKRLVGLPGDHVQIENQVLSVNGDEARRREIHDLGSEEFNHFHQGDRTFVETLGLHSYRIALGDLQRNSLETIKVPAGAVFVMGDNRDHSKDSRDFDSIPLTDILGRVDQIWLSIHWRDGRRVGRSGISFPASIQPASFEFE